MSKINNYEDLLVYFINEYDEKTIYPFLEDKHLKDHGHKEEQESFFRLCAHLRLIPEFNNYKLCKGNYNMGTIEETDDIRSLMKKNTKDTGDVSDLTLLGENEILACSSKNFSGNYFTRSLDIEALVTVHEKHYTNLKLRICLIVRSKEMLEEVVGKSKKTSNYLCEWIEDSSTIIIEWKDLNEYFLLLKSLYKSVPKNYSPEIPLSLYFHQELTVIKTVNMINEKYKNILWGHKPRSGKTYIMAGLISKLFETSQNNVNFNVLILTTAPNETKEQIETVFKFKQFKEFKYTYLDNRMKHKPKSNRNIFVCSKQFLQTKGVNGTKGEIKWLSGIKFDIRFIDESHFGGSTILAQNTLKIYGVEAPTIYLTATFSKPVTYYGIPRQAQCIWDIRDEKMCKEISIEKNRLDFIDKHGIEAKELLENYTTDKIENTYRRYPTLVPTTIVLKENLANKVGSLTSGFSIESLMMLKNDKKKKSVKSEFANETELDSFCRLIFTKRFLDDDEIDDDQPNVMKDIKNKTEEPDKLTGQTSRWFDKKDPLIILAFLPTGIQNMPIDKVSKAFRDFLIGYKYFAKEEIVIVNSSETSNPKKDIEDARIRLKRQGKHDRIIALSGRQCSLGVSLEYCDIVLMLNNVTSNDLYDQMKYRGMTEMKGKRYGFVIDPNFQRMIKHTIDEARKIYPGVSVRDALKEYWESNMMNFFIEKGFNIFSKDIDKTQEAMIKIYNSDPKNNIKRILTSLKLKVNNLSDEDKSFFQKIGKGASKDIITKNDIIEVEESYENNKVEGLKKGIKVVGVSDHEEDSDDDKAETDVPEEDVGYLDDGKEDDILSEVFKYLIPLVVILSVNSKYKSFNEMCIYIKKDERLSEIINNQLGIWWGDKIEEENDINLFDVIQQLYEKYLNESEDIDTVVMNIKAEFVNLLSKPKDLSELINEYLTPMELEKKQNAEVSTPFFLKQEMLNKVPIEFWTIKRHKIFEPCCGKGGFLIDLVDRLMIGLKDKIKNEKKRYKWIVEEMIYFGDINPTNIYVTELLLDPKGEYILNYCQGDTLTLDSEESFGTRFDLVVGNPPYNMSGNIATGNTIWQQFVKKALTSWIKNDGYLLFVHPPGWRKPCYDRSQLKGLFDLLTKQNNMIYLEIHDAKDGMKTFKCGTRYDWYLVKKTKNLSNTIVVDEDKVETSVDMKEWEWFPNGRVELIRSLLINDGVGLDVICNSSYHATRSYVKNDKDDEYCYPLIHSTPKSGIRCKYTNRHVINKTTKVIEHFGVPKVIFGDSGIYNPIVDIDGDYGMTQHAMAIKVSNRKEGENLSKVLTSEKMKNIIDSCSYSSYAIDWCLFTHFKKDFWKEL